MKAIILGCAIATIPTVAIARTDCMKVNTPDQVAEGKLARRIFKDAAGRPEAAFIVSLPTPECLHGSDGDESVAGARTVHIYSSNPAISRRIPRFTGRAVLIKGEAFGALTLHHHAPIMMNVTEIHAQ